ncbi:MAG: hypothetical protein IKL95_00620 [Alphaproteobacteria bacterium]|nr:hypothetical protein [Alphaproteobacteria bacterium]
MIKMHAIFRKILIAIFAVFIAIPAFADDVVGGSGDIGDFGRWATEENRNLVTSRIVDELQHFGPTATNVTHAYVPVEAKVGLAFIGGMTQIATALDKTLGQFAIMFMLIAYAFWVAFEAYNLIGTAGDAKKTIENVLKKGLIISVWLIVLKFGIARAFTMIMVPIVSAGTFIATTIWESITSAAGYTLPNTCEAIRQYATTALPGNVQITADAASGLLCIPPQMSAFFMTIIEIGWKWVIAGVGTSLFTSIIGIYITYLALKSIWKYMFIALGVIADIFLSLLLLPFTAIAETTAKTQYKGVAGDIFNTFLDIFKAEKLETQITRIVKAALYFVCLAVATGVAVSLLTFVVNPASGEILTSGGLDGAILLILSLMLVCYMAEKSQKLASDWGGKIETGFGDQVKKDTEKLWELTKKRWKQTRDLFKK